MGIRSVRRHTAPCTPQRGVGQHGPVRSEGGTWQRGRDPPSSPAQVLSAPAPPAAQGPRAPLTPWEPRPLSAGGRGSPRDSGAGILWLPSPLGTGSRRLPPRPGHPGAPQGARMPSGPEIPSSSGWDDIVLTSTQGTFGLDIRKTSTGRIRH